MGTRQQHRPPGPTAGVCVCVWRGCQADRLQGAAGARKPRPTPPLRAETGPEGPHTALALPPPAARGRAPTWTGPGASGRSASGCGWTRSPWTRRAERGPGPGPSAAPGAPGTAHVLPQPPGRAENFWGTLCCSFVFVPLGFFCLISVISDRHEMTIKGFLMKNKSLLLVCQRPWAAGAGQGVHWGTRGWAAATLGGGCWLPSPSLRAGERGLSGHRMAIVLGTRA